MPMNDTIGKFGISAIRVKIVSVTSHISENKENFETRKQTCQSTRLLLLSFTKICLLVAEIVLPVPKSTQIRALIKFRADND